MRDCSRTRGREEAPLDAFEQDAAPSRGGGREAPFVTGRVPPMCPVRSVTSVTGCTAFHHPHHRPTNPDVTGPPARFPIFLPTTPITLSGSRRSGRFRGRVPPTALSGPLSPEPLPQRRERRAPATVRLAGPPGPGLRGNRQGGRRYAGPRLKRSPGAPSGASP